MSRDSVAYVARLHSSGWGGIRTHGGFRHKPLAGAPIRPLSHPSEVTTLQRSGVGRDRRATRARGFHPSKWRDRMALCSDPGPLIDRVEAVRLDSTPISPPLHRCIHEPEDIREGASDQAMDVDPGQWVFPAGTPESEHVQRFNLPVPLRTDEGGSMTGAAVHTSVPLTRPRSAGTPGPSSWSMYEARPAMLITRARDDPVTSGPVPVANGPSSARS